jgi:3D (Asp-Asp-Asp) domain-containing protein
MLNAAAALAMLLSMAFPGLEGPISYEAAVAADAAGQTTGVAAESSQTDEAPELSDEQADMMARDPDWQGVNWTMYHAGGGGATGNDSLGCRPVAMRTIATDPRVIPRRTRVFIRETVGMRMADGAIHDGYWYASDTGGAIKGAKVDLYTGNGSASMRPVRAMNLRRLTIVDAGRFDGCPPSWETASTARSDAR